MNVLLILFCNTWSKTDVIILIVFVHISVMSLSWNSLKLALGECPRDTLRSYFLKWRLKLPFKVLFKRRLAFCITSFEFALLKLNYRFRFSNFRTWRWQLRILRNSRLCIKSAGCWPLCRKKSNTRSERSDSRPKVNQGNAVAIKFL